MNKQHFPSSELKIPLACSSGLKTSKFEQHCKPTSRNKEGPAAGSARLQASGGERRDKITRSWPKLKSLIWGKANCLGGPVFLTVPYSTNRTE